MPIRTHESLESSFSGCETNAFRMTSSNSSLWKKLPASQSIPSVAEKRLQFVDLPWRGVALRYFIDPGIKSEYSLQ